MSAICVVIAARIALIAAWEPDGTAAGILGRVNFTVPGAAARAAVTVAARLGIACSEPVVLAGGANVIVHLSPAPVVAKVAASTPAVRPDAGAWLQRELDVALFLTRYGAPVLEPSPDVPATPHHGDGHVMSFWPPGSRCASSCGGCT
jgi:hypothetical protein